MTDSSKNRPLKPKPSLSPEVGAKAARKLKARRNTTQGVWFGLGMMGLIGWSVVVPTLLGAAFGIWLDNRHPGSHSWTLTLLVIVKSRQMMMTWLFTALSLWDAMFHQGRLIMLQSKTEREAVGDEYSGQGLLGRCKFMLRQCPPWLVPTYTIKSTQVIFPTMNSTLWAIPQGAAIIRSYTSAGILSDECAFQDEFSDAYGAAVPTIRGGGWFVALSSAHPGFFQQLWQDTVGHA